MKLIKRLALSALSLCLALAASACGAPSGEPGGDAKHGGVQGANRPMGRYVEKNLELPEGISPENSILTYVNADGSLDLYGFADAEMSRSVHWRSADGVSWEQDSGDWMKVLPTACFFRYAADAPDGGRYLLVEDQPGALHLIYVKGETAEEIPVPSWRTESSDVGVAATPGGSVTIGVADAGGSDGDVSAEDGDSVNEGEEVSGVGLPALNARGMAVLDNGDLLIGFMTGGAVRYTPSGEEVRRYPMTYLLDMAVISGKLYGYSFDGDRIQCFDLETGAEEAAMPLENTVATNPSCIFSDREGNLYSANSGGIHRIIPGGSIWETVLDGKLSAINAPSTDLRTVLPDGKGGFYLNYYTQAGGIQLSHAVYDENTPSVPSRELSVYSLRKNDTVQQAIVSYQAKNPDVMVNYQAALGDDSSATVEDVIRALNQEILAGKGPDVLILDGLPVESYVEKGVLADLSGLADSLDGSYFEAVLQTYRQEDGTLPAIPVRFNVPMMFGRDNALDGVQTLADLAKGGEDAMTLTDGRGFLQLLSKASYPAWTTGGGVDGEKLALFLTDAKAIFDRYGKAPSEESSTIISYSSRSGGGVITLGEDYLDFRNEKTKRLLTEVTGMSYFMMVDDDIGNMTDKGMQAKPLVGQSAGCFLPSAVAGVNAAGKQQEEAMDFVKTLLSTEVQYLSFNDGFGVSETALDKEIERYRKMLRDNSYADVDYGVHVKPLLASLKTPVFPDQTLLDAVLDEGAAVLRGEQSVEDAVQAVQKKMELRLAE